jgi:hypothetical protein
MLTRFIHKLTERTSLHCRNLSKEVEERGLRQGAPISLMLFILAIDPLQRVLHLAAKRGVLHPISPRSKGIKASLYANDAVIFVSPRKHDIVTLKDILVFFLASYRALH